MGTQIIALGNTAADSPDITLADGASTTIAIFGFTDARAFAQIKLKLSDNSYSIIGTVTPGAGAKVIAAPGIYRITRPAGYTCGVSRD